MLVFSLCWYLGHGGLRQHDNQQMEGQKEILFVLSLPLSRLY